MCLGGLSNSRAKGSRGDITRAAFVHKREWLPELDFPAKCLEAKAEFNRCCRRALFQCEIVIIHEFPIAPELAISDVLCVCVYVVVGIESRNQKFIYSANASELWRIYRGFYSLSESLRNIFCIRCCAMRHFVLSVLLDWFFFFFKVWLFLFSKSIYGFLDFSTNSNIRYQQLCKRINCNKQQARVFQNTLLYTYTEKKRIIGSHPQKFKAAFSPHIYI